MHAMYIMDIVILSTVASCAARLQIIVNPPFVGGMMMTPAQKIDIFSVFDNSIAGLGELDYVAAWYRKAVDLMKNTKIETAFVSTNSITQGEQVAILWESLCREGIKINFAYRTFRWDSEASIKAHVHVIISGFSFIERPDKFLFTEDGEIQHVDHINSYFTAAPDVFLHNLSKPLCENAPAMSFGNMPRDGGGFILTEDERSELINNEPLSGKWIHLFLGAIEFINNKKRYCLWLDTADPHELRNCPYVLKRIDSVRMFRLSSKAKSTRDMAQTPTRFAQITQKVGEPFLLIPRVSSQNRRYIPMGFFTGDVIASDAVQIICNADLYHFGVLTSNVHMAWMRSVCGRLKSDYRYSKDIVYNNFPWPEATPEQRDQIAQTAQAILDVRARYPDSSLADLYDDLTMPADLRKAHQDNDRAVMRTYGMPIRETDEAACVAWLFRLYNKLTEHATNPVS